MKTSSFSLLAASAIAALFALSPPLQAAAELVSGGANGATVRGKASVEPSISGEGRRVVFSSLAALVPEDRNGLSDVYLRERGTGALRLISDDRGGDQPLISADGEHVTFRSLDAFPKVRRVDLRTDDGPLTVSYPFGGGRSFRYADSAATTPDGAFVAFAFRPIPGFSNSTDPQLAVTDTTAVTADDRSDASESITDDFLLSTLGRSAMTRDGNTFFVETSDGADEGLANADTNQAQDIYRVERNSTAFLRVSAAPGGDPQPETEGKGARDPVLTARGDVLFFISDRRLRSSDEDGGATIYRSTSATGFATPEAISTGAVRPVALSRQATGDGRYLVFLGRPRAGAPRPYLLRLSDGQLTALAPNAPAQGGAPAISADNALIVFSSPAPLARRDGNRAPDVFATPNPDAAARIASPTVELTAPANGSVIAEGAGVNLAANASSGATGMFTTTIEVDGRALVTANGATAQSNGVQLARGFHTIRATALNNANVPGRSAEVNLIVRPAANRLQITGLAELARTALSDGTTEFSGMLRIDNTFAAPRGPVQVIVTEAATPATWEIFGNEDETPSRPERVLQVFDLAALGANGNAVLDLAGAVSAPETVGDGFQGVGYTIKARLRESVGGIFNDRDELILFEVRPRLNEETPGPNGGIPELGTPDEDDNFNPAVLIDLTVQGRANVSGRTSARYAATAVFNTGSKPCAPRWEVLNGGTFARISASGLLTVGDVPAPRTIMVKATFGSQTDTLNVTVRPFVPALAVTAAALAQEPSTVGSFRISRSGPLNEALDVSYEVSGKATAGDDYAALSGTATIPAGARFVTLPVTPADDADPEGRETVILRLLPGDYRLGAAPSATVTIFDDEPIQADQADAVIRVGRRGFIGVEVFSTDGIHQQAFARGLIGRPAVFSCAFVNRTPAAQNYTITGAGDFLGFSVRYFVGRAEVTAAVVAGTHGFNAVEPGRAVPLRVLITPGAATPLGAVMRCPITVRTDSGILDVVEAVVERVR